MYLERQLVLLGAIVYLSTLSYADESAKDIKGIKTYLKRLMDLDEEPVGDAKRGQGTGEPGDETYGTGNYEGDILLTPEQLKKAKEMEQGGGSSLFKRKFYKLAKLWPGNIVYYELPAADPGCQWYGTSPFCRGSSTDCTSRGMIFKSSSSKGCWTGTKVCCTSYTWRNKILDGMKHIERNTCIRFKKRITGNRLRFIDGTGCSSNLGMTGTSFQNVNLMKNGCMSRGTVVHELLHALGFHHEQTREDRDSYVNIYYSNIIGGREGNFHKNKIDTKGIKYDIQSVMQYGSKAFSKNGGRTITVKGNIGHNDLLGQREAMSYYDRLIVNKVYGCSNKGVGLQDNNCMWIGTAPFCGGQASDCTNRGMRYSHSDTTGDGHKCWSGNKVCCKRYYKCKKWIGTAPFCGGTSWDCEKNNLYFMRFGYYGGDGNQCWTGKKVCCG